MYCAESYLALRSRRQHGRGAVTTRLRHCNRLGAGAAEGAAARESLRRSRDRCGLRLLLKVCSSRRGRVCTFCTNILHLRKVCNVSSSSGADSGAILAISVPGCGCGSEPRQPAQHSRKRRRRNHARRQPLSQEPVRCCGMSGWNGCDAPVSSLTLPPAPEKLPAGSGRTRKVGHNLPASRSGSACSA